MSLLFNVQSRFVIDFLPRSKHLLISWLQSLSAVILKPKKRKSVSVSTFPIYLPWSAETGCHYLTFLSVDFKPAFHSPLSLSSRGSLIPLHFLPLEWYHLHILGCWYFSGNLNFSLCFMQPGILQNELCIEVKWAEWQYTALMYYVWF